MKTEGYAQIWMGIQRAGEEERFKGPAFTGHADALAKLRPEILRRTTSVRPACGWQAQDNELDYPGLA